MLATTWRRRYRKHLEKRGTDHPPMNELAHERGRGPIRLVSPPRPRSSAPQRRTRTPFFVVKATLRPTDRDSSATDSRARAGPPPPAGQPVGGPAGAAG